MKKIYLIIVLVSSFSFAQQSDNKINESRMSTINQDSYEKICLNISKIFEEYDCKEDLNKKIKIVNQNEELSILLKRKNFKLSYSSSQNRGEIYNKYQELVKIMDNK